MIIDVIRCHQNLRSVVCAFCGVVVHKHIVLRPLLARIRARNARTLTGNRQVVRDVVFEFGVFVLFRVWRSRLDASSKQSVLVGINGFYVMRR